ncbi:hypothetical protein [Methanobrevibacter curvatus]|nr:hypothetical protein [Methanobrevibacter curvatus]
MNAWSSPRQNEYIDIMKSVIKHPPISEELKNQINEDLIDFEE